MTDNDNKDPQIREAFDKWYKENGAGDALGFQLPIKSITNIAFQAGAAWQAAQQVQVSKVLELCYTSFGKMRKCDHLDQQIAESSQNMIKATLAAINNGDKNVKP